MYYLRCPTAGLGMISWNVLRTCEACSCRKGRIITMFSANDSSRYASSQAKAYRGINTGTLVIIIVANADRSSRTCVDGRHEVALLTQRHILSNTTANLNPNPIASRSASIRVAIANSEAPSAYCPTPLGRRRLSIRESAFEWLCREFH